MTNKIELHAHHDGELSDDFIDEAQQLLAKYGFMTSIHRTFCNVIIVASPNQALSVAEPEVGSTSEIPLVAPEADMGAACLDPNGPQEFVTTLGSSESSENCGATEIPNAVAPVDEPIEQPTPTITGKCVIRNLSSYHTIDYVVNELEPFSKLLVSSATPGETIKFSYGDNVHYMPRYEGSAGVSTNTPNLQANNIVRFIISLGDVDNTESFPCILEVCEFEGADSSMVIFGQDMADFVKSNTQ